ncbi:MAG: hypothetical protein JSV23_04505 [Promethearchaeota archaeon]|nr:MAG: hypothetical protein JSV23_04505 [Candidatus Lokiarchaeota archaeon]
MENKFSPQIQIEINDIINEIQKWKKFFDSKTEFYYDGWAIFLREKNLYPRTITIFKSYERNTYSIKSFEVHLKNYNKEEYKELYSVENIKDKTELVQQLKDLIYGKDLLEDASKIYKKTFL